LQAPRNDSIILNFTEVYRIKLFKLNWAKYTKKSIFMNEFELLIKNYTNSLWLWHSST